MKHRRSRSDQRRSQYQHRKTAGARQQQKTDQGRTHSDCQGIGLRAMVGKESDSGLK
jgi:hypothetical protein